MDTHELATLPDTFRTATAYLTAAFNVADDQTEAPIVNALAAELAARPPEELVMVFAAMTSALVCDVAAAHGEERAVTWRRHTAGYAVVLDGGGIDG
ncbi:hypothetical protein [Streptomyces sp. NPDC058758]|uniref:hypothetical protein n=1 Tax=Streptomyces sp. NPDC058758 TaxID=3346627 RepID=UPI00368F7DAE